MSDWLKQLPVICPACGKRLSQDALLEHVLFFCRYRPK